MRGSSLTARSAGRRLAGGLTLAGWVVVAAAVLAPVSARAQAFVELLQVNGQNALTGRAGYNRAACDAAEESRLFLRLRGLTEPTYFLRLVQYDVAGPLAPCPADMLEPVRAEVLPSFALVPMGSEYTLDRTLTAEQLLGSAACAQPGVRANMHLCLQLTVLPGDRRAVLTAGIPIDYDTTLPPTLDPVDVAVTPGATRLTFDVEVPGATEPYDLVAEYRLCPEDDPDAGAPADAGADGMDGGDAGRVGQGDDASSLCGAEDGFATARSEGGSQLVINGLPPGRRVEVRLSLVDDFGNIGPPGPLGVYRTSSGVGPLELYDGAGSPTSCAASCADVSSGVAGLGGLLLLRSRRTRRAWRALVGGDATPRGLVRALLVLLALLVPAGLTATTAHAGPGQTTVGLGIADLHPAMDDEKVEGRAIFPVYGCLFGGKGALELGADFDTHIYDGFGSLQLSFGIGLAQAQGKAQQSVGAACGEASDVDVQLTLLKARPGLTYRLDPLLDSVSFPLVPYGRVGLVLQGYAFTNDGDFDQGRADPVGLRTGWEAAGGLMLALDFLDSLDPFVPDTTRRARANGAFDHTFLFVEGAYQVVDDFGAPGFIFSPRDTLFDTDLPVLWRVGVAVELL